jgi:type II secretory pathway pseudopilin PulG
MKLFQPKIHTSLPTGFTIVETLVAIAILMIAIVGPLSIASKGLTSALNSKDQMVALFLAQETMETVKNVKDNNIAGGASSWIETIAFATNASHMDLGAVDPMVACSPIECALYIHPTYGYYTAQNIGPQSIFNRYFYLSKPGVSTACEVTDHECQVHVIVSWKEGRVPNQISLTDEITDSTR